MKSEKPLFSIITVCWNPGKALLPTIESLRGQEFLDYEFIVIDGASTDGTAAMLRERFHGLITILVSEKDRGIYDAMNKGISLAKGRYIYFLNAGDSFYDPKVLTDVAKSLEAHQFPDIVFGDIAFPSTETGPFGAIQSRKHCDITDIFYKPINHQSIFSSRESLQHGFHTPLKMLADYHWFLSRLMKTSTRILHVPRLIAYYDVKGYSATNAEILQSELRTVREMYFRKGYVSLLSRIKGTKLMYLLKVKLIKKILNRTILKTSITREYVSNV